MDPIETVPTSVETPSEAPIEETPAVTETAPATAEPTVQLYDLPDGRKVDADTLTKEWKENFLPDYTRKSQELAKAKESTLPTDTTNNPLANPDWIPSSYSELVEVAKEALKQDLQAQKQAEIDHKVAVENEVSNQLDAVKKIDPNINESSLFQHAVKYGFRDLTIAYQNMKDMSVLVKNVQKTTADNIAKRNDPVSASPGASGTRPDASNFSSARDFLRSLNN